MLKLLFSCIIPSQCLHSVRKLMTARETHRVQCTISGPPFLHSVCLKASFVESFELQNWGLFEHSVLNLGSTPLFAVITGETGSGKSVLISALQFLYSSSGKKYVLVVIHVVVGWQDETFASPRRHLSNCHNASFL